jgi:hypothetical protein
MKNFKVRKRGGGVEPWNIDKTINSVAVAGVSMNEARYVAGLVEEWADKNSESGIVSSSEIRNKVTELLKVVDPVAHDTYVAYKK